MSPIRILSFPQSLGCVKGQACVANTPKKIRRLLRPPLCLSHLPSSLCNDPRVWRNIRIQEPTGVMPRRHICEIQPVKNCVTLNLTVILSQKQSLPCFWIKLHWTRRDQVLVPSHAVSSFLRHPSASPMAVLLSRDVVDQGSQSPPLQAHTF